MDNGRQTDDVSPATAHGGGFTRFQSKEEEKTINKQKKRGEKERFTLCVSEPVCRRHITAGGLKHPNDGDSSSVYGLDEGTK